MDFPTQNNGRIQNYIDKLKVSVSQLVSSLASSEKAGLLLVLG
jgi:hypothetical protein